MYQRRIAFLEETLRQLDSKSSEGSTADLVEHRNRVLSELSRLRRLQWEEDHDRVHIDDDDR